MFLASSYAVLPILSDGIIKGKGIHANTWEIIWLGIFAEGSLPNGFIGYDYPTGEQEFFHVMVGEIKAAVKLDTMAADLGRETMVLIAVRE